jgi:hypothetical protein
MFTDIIVSVAAIVAATLTLAPLIVMLRSFLKGLQP